MWFFNTTNIVKDDSLEVQVKEHAVKAFNKLMDEISKLNDEMKPLIEERDKYFQRMVELCDYARVCQVLKEVLDKETFKKVRTIWDKYSEEHEELSIKKDKTQLKINSLSLKREALVKRAQNIHEENSLYKFRIQYPIY